MTKKRLRKSMKTAKTLAERRLDSREAGGVRGGTGRAKPKITIKFSPEVTR
jgi:hypothetical protein